MDIDQVNMVSAMENDLGKIDALYSMGRVKLGDAVKILSEVAHFHMQCSIALARRVEQLEEEAAERRARYGESMAQKIARDFERARGSRQPFFGEE